MPKIYGDEDTSEEEGIELADGARVSQEDRGWCRRLRGGKPRKKPTAGDGAGTSGGGGAQEGGGPSTSGAGGSGGKKRGRDGDGDGDGDDDDPTSAGRPEMGASSRNSRWLVKNHARKL